MSPCLRVSAVRRSVLGSALFWAWALIAAPGAAEAQAVRAATLISVQGATTVRPSGAGVFLNAARKMILHTGDLVSTGANGRATLLFADGSQVKLNANTVLLIPSTASARELPSRLGLSRGEIWAHIRSGRHVRIETPSVLAWVRGTEFDLQLDADQTATLTVAEGEVRLESGQASVTVRETQQSVARPGQAPTLPVTVNVPFIVQWATDLQPVALLLEVAFVSQDPARLRDALAEAERLPGGPERQQRLGDIHHDRGELLPALEAYEAARAQTQLEARIGQTHLELGRLPEAEAAFRRALALDPGLTTARTGLVMTLLSRRDTTAALAEARAAVERDGRSPVARTALALAQIRRGEPENARRELSEAIRLDASYPQAYAWQAFLLRAEGRLDAAEEAARRAVALAPYSSLAHSALADTLFAAGRTKEARAEGRRAVALNPLSPGAHVSLGRTLLQEGEFEGAARAANRAVALDPDLDRARFLLGVVLAEQRQLNRAAAELRKAVELDPQHLEARAFLARVYLEQGRQNDAISVVRAAIAQNPQFAPARAALGRVYWRAGRLEEAAAEYRQALEREPASALYHLELARVALDANHLPEALAHGLAAVVAAPASSEAHAELARVYERMGNAEQATREYQDALSLSADNAMAWAGFGLLTVQSAFGAGLSEVARSLLQSRSYDGQGELVQAVLRDPSVPSMFFKPGVTTELAPGAGNHANRTLDFTHRDQYFGGKLHDLSFGSEVRMENDRTGRRERTTVGMMNLMGSPAPRVHLHGSVFHLGGENPIPGPTFQPDPDDRVSHALNTWSLATRIQLDPATSVWFQASQPFFRLVLENPDARADAGLPERVHLRHDQAYLEGRIDHRWGRHTVSYVLSGARDLADTRVRLPGSAPPGPSEASFRNRRGQVAHTLREDYRSGARLSVVLGVTAQRDTDRGPNLLANPPQLLSSERAETRWLPFGQVTYVPSRRDLVRALYYKRRQRGFFFLLKPSETFQLGEIPSLTLGTQTTSYELDYEHRFSPRSFAKLFLFRSDVQELDKSVPLAPSLLEPLPNVGFRVPEARLQGIGARYEHQFGRFLSSYLRFVANEQTDRTPSATRGRQLPMSPRSQAALGVSYVDRAGTKLYAQVNWSSRLFIDPRWSGQEGFDPFAPRPRYPSKAVLSLRFAKERTVRREWVIRINNVFNTETLLWPGFPAPGRTYQVEHHVRF